MLEKIFVFTKAQISSFIGGAVDYLIMILCTEFLGVHYTISIAIGGVVGAIVNFFINKKWTFNTKGYRYKYSFRKQLSAFILVVINSILLKASGTYYITTYYKIGYGFSRIIMDLIVSVCINYNLQRHLIFKKIRS